MKDLAAFIPVCILGCLAMSGNIFAQGLNKNGLGDHLDAETNETAVTLSQIEKDAVDRFAQKYQKFPGPSDDDIKKVAQIVLLKQLNKANVQAMLGKACSLPSSSSCETLETWAYDVGDSQRIEVQFDLDGRVRKITGIGVGFNELEAPIQTNISPDNITNDTDEGENSVSSK